MYLLWKSTLASGLSIFIMFAFVDLWVLSRRYYLRTCCLEHNFSFPIFIQKRRQIEITNWKSIKSIIEIKMIRFVYVVRIVYSTFLKDFLYVCMSYIIIIICFLSAHPWIINFISHNSFKLIIFLYFIFLRYNILYFFWK